MSRVMRDCLAAGMKLSNSLCVLISALSDIFLLLTCNITELIVICRHMFTKRSPCLEFKSVSDETAGAYVGFSK